MHAPLDRTSATPPRPSLPLPLDARVSFYRRTFSTLRAPTGEALRGRFRAVFVGPWWLRLPARPSIGLAGLRNWFGKELTGPGDAYNLVWRRGELARSLPMTLNHRASVLDGAPCGVLFYGPKSPFPFGHIVDELRALNDDCLLGMTIVEAPLLRNLGLPFLLLRAE